MNYSFYDRTRDLADILATVSRDEPRFISNFRQEPASTKEVHTYSNDVLNYKGFTAESGQAGSLIVPTDVVRYLTVGGVIRLVDDCALFEITSVASNGEVTVKLANSLGSSITSERQLKESDLMFDIVTNHPALTDEVATDQWNSFQSFYKDVIVSGSLIVNSPYNTSTDNLLNRQTAFALSDLARDLNRVALYGRRVAASESSKGEAGGLYYFANEFNAPVIDAKNSIVNSQLINAAASTMIRVGAEPVQILCSPGQARVISDEYRDRIQILRSDDRRGAYVAVIVNEINGRGMTIMADPDVVDTDIWVLDTSCFSIVAKDVKDTDTTPAEFDGIRRSVTATLTFGFRNVRQRCCRIRNVMHSAASLLPKTVLYLGDN